jgi:hypothetical protein
MRMVEGLPSARAARIFRGRAAPPAGWLALAYWRAILRALNLPVALLYRACPALRLDPRAEAGPLEAPAPRPGA